MYTKNVQGQRKYFNDIVYTYLSKKYEPYGQSLNYLTHKMVVRLYQNEIHYQIISNSSVGYFYQFEYIKRNI